MAFELVSARIVRVVFMRLENDTIITLNTEKKTNLATSSTLKQELLLGCDNYPLLIKFHSIGVPFDPTK